MQIPGPTGTHDRPKIHADDAGGLYATCGIHENYVIFDFGVETTWVATSPEEAMMISMLIGRKAMELSTKTGKPLDMNMSGLEIQSDDNNDRNGFQVFLNHANLIETRMPSPVRILVFDAQGAFIYATKIMILVHQIRPDLTAHMNFPRNSEVM